MNSIVRAMRGFVLDDEATARVDEAEVDTEDAKEAAEVRVQCCATRKWFAVGPPRLFENAHVIPVERGEEWVRWLSVFLRPSPELRSFASC